MIMGVDKPAPPGMAHQSRKLEAAMMPRFRKRKGLRFRPRSKAAPRKGAVSAAITPAHLVTDATVACPCAPATARAFSGDKPSRVPLASRSPPIMSRAKYGANM